MLHKLNKLQKELQNGHYIGCEDDAREVRVAIEHIKRYKDIDKYTIDYEYDPVLDKWDFDVIAVDDNNAPTLYTHVEKNPERSKIRMRIHMEQEKLSQWHWKELWKLISNRAQQWLD